MSEKWTAWDPAEDIDTLEDAIGYLNAILEENAALLPAALGDIARSRGMSEVSAQSGLGRESLYKALSDNAQPRFTTIEKVLRSLDMRLAIVPAAEVAAR